MATKKERNNNMTVKSGRIKQKGYAEVAHNSVTHDDMRHKQVIVKVNRYVDEEMKPLIEILNTLDKVWTCESCQRDGHNRGWVSLNYGDEDTREEEVIRFTKKLVHSVKKQVERSVKLFPNRLFPLLGDSYISIQWSGGYSPWLYITFPADEIKEATTIFSDVVHSLQARCKERHSS